jgi:hypothetical protein
MFLTYICLWVKVASGIKYISAVRSRQLDLNMPWEFPCKERLRRCIKSLKRKFPTKLRVFKFPITTALLSLFLRFLDFGLHNDRMFWAASCCAVYQFWRGSEFLSRPIRPSTTSNPLLKTHLVWENDERSHLKTNLLYTKTKWWRDDIWTQAWQNQSVSSPTDAMAQYLDKATPRAAGSPWLFAMADGNILTRKYMINRTRELATKCRLDPKLFICSSWRTGGGNSASEAKQPRRIIKGLGRWKSNAFENYITISPLDLKLAGDAMATHSTSTLNLTSLISSWGKGKHPLGRSE